MPSSAVFPMRGRWWTRLLAGLPMALAAAGAQKTERPRPIDPCCQITAVSQRDGLVTARERSTGRAFQFRVTDHAQLASLHPGRAVWADFGMNRVSIAYGTPCCDITGFAGTAQTVGSSITSVASGALVATAGPCCEIVAIAPANSSSGALVTARNTTTGAVFEFRVSDVALLRTLTIGRAISANMATMKVTVYGVEPCCQITRVVSAGTP